MAGADDPFFEEKEPTGPITDAYLHRDVHPDQKAGHAKADGHLFPHTLDEAPSSIDDLWQYY